MTLHLPFREPARAGRHLVRSWYPDLVVGIAVLALLAALANLSAGLVVPFGPGEQPSVTADPAALPWYAGRSLLRMLVALIASVVFALAYGYAAARSRRAERILIPLLDVLQSVPVLGFLSVTVTGFIALFPGSLLGLECASIFAIFTSQAWNIAFAVYHSLAIVPRDLVEAARLYRLSRWRRFRLLELPATTVPLVWNSMMSMGGAWFFLVASEAISVNGRSYTLPGIGSYVGAAIDHGDAGAIGLALATMVVLVVGVDRLFWHPIVAWAERFKVEESVSGERAESAILELVRRSRLAALTVHVLAAGFAAVLAAVGTALGALGSRIGRAVDRPGKGAGAEVVGPPTPGDRLAAAVGSDRAFDLVLSALLLLGGAWLVHYLLAGIDAADLATAIADGLLTFVRVVAVVGVSALVWTPVGVWIGLNPRVARVAQPLVQVAASFPANFLFPFATLLMLRTGFPIELGAIPLMALGAQWYLLFNAIAGAMAIPNDLREAASVLRLSRRQRWRALILPGIFPALVTGAITATGGAWNASIVAELVSWGPDTLRAHGLGAYIADATAVGDFPRTFLGIAVMALFVVGVNRLVWRRLYSLAETRFRIA